MFHKGMGHVEIVHCTCSANYLYALCHHVEIVAVASCVHCQLF